MSLSKFKEAFGIFLMLLGHGITSTGGDGFIGLIFAIVGVVVYSMSDNKDSQSHGNQSKENKE